MLEELKDKMDRLYHDHDNKQLQKEIMGLALTELSNICISGLQVYEDNKDYINNMIGQDLVNSDTCSHIREFLIEENDMEGTNANLWNVFIPDIFRVLLLFRKTGRFIILF